ncbi:hypothetical protein CR513_09969, partial [Mucuna pruriens]
MPITRNQASSTNEGEEDTLQRLLRAVASLQARSDEQSRLSVKVEQRHAKAKERCRRVEERHLDAMRAAKRREEELRQQIAAIRAEKERDQEEEIDETPIPPNFREVVVEPFDESQDPHAHLQAFQTQMYISGGNDRLSCRLFLGMLRGVAMQWMATLPPRSIQTFKDLASSFLSEFAVNKVKRLEIADLFDIRQTEGESLKNYLARFNNATKGLRAGPFSDALALRKPVNMEEDQYKRWRSERRAELKEVRQTAKAREDKRPMLARVNEQAQRFTPLIEKRAQMMHEICHTSLLEYPMEAKGKLMGKEKSS